MDWTDFLTALALVFVIEGVLPFISPDRYRETMLQLVNLDSDTLRKIGIGSMVIGVVLLYLVRR